MSESAVRHAISGLTNLLKLVIGRGRIQTVDDTGVIQVVQIVLSPLETPDLLRMAEFGFTSWPMANCDGLAVFINGQRSNGVVIATNDQRYRFKLENAGEVALSDAFGKSIWFKKTGGIVINANGQDVQITNANNVTVTATTKVTVDAPNVEFTGDVLIDGNLVVDGTINGE